MKHYQQHLGLFLKHLEVYQAGLSSKKPAELYEPENYILKLGGKRLRPMLALVACDLFDKDPALALDAALSVELFHNFSLIHDDILDAAPLRRNQPSVHVKWNTGIAILSGDVMLVKAFSLLENYEPLAYKQLSSLFHSTAIEVCEGQQLDMNFEKTLNVTVDDYISMITFKTAVLLGCSLRMGAISAAANEVDQAGLYNFGKHLGIAFQLLDDLLDAFSEKPEDFGKQQGGDILANKKTFLLLKALDLASERQKQTIHRLLNMTESRGKEKITGMLAIYHELGIKEHCRAEADKHTQIALDCLKNVQANPEKLRTLAAFSRELLDRQV